jgi:hypothetical protein
MAFEPTRGSAWLYQQLATDSPLAALIGAAGNPAPGAGGEFVFTRRAPRTATMPYIIINQVGIEPQPETVQQDRVWQPVRYWISLWTPTADDTVIEPIMDRIEAVLPKRGGPILDGYVVSCLRTNVDSRPSDVQGDLSIQTYAEYTLQIRVP